MAYCGDCIHLDVCKTADSCCGSVPRCKHFLSKKTGAVDVVEVADGYSAGDVCFYGFHPENKSLALVEIVRVLDDARCVAEVKFLKVFVDDTVNGMFHYLLKSGHTMNASFKYLRNITPIFGTKEG